MINIRGDDLRRMRLRKNRTTQQLADFLGVSRATYENWEHDVGQPKMNQFFRLCAYCSIDLSHVSEQIEELEKKAPSQTRKKKDISPEN